ncbi:YceI family protein [Chryseobacterium sp. SSA4.19]|uniref:YceI family protein n=1 Tax=Chryseobacterium sp. SSA4.19 TaxID=2919915 RepID=UPI001F4E186C|nr:YceI family protein [Chryseobacterium sp. SSA4.19]MCJ8152632.1 YceI family protein [Chryseobacterium sp. SSA4.19]
MTRFNIQTESSTVNWTGRKVLGLHTGTIQIKEGFLSFQNDHITDGNIDIDMTSIVITDIEDKAVYKAFFDHLNNDDLFAVDQFKTASLKIRSGNKDRNRYTINGDLTIKEITHPAEFIATVEIFTDFLHVMGEIEIDRTLYNIRYGSGKFLPNLGDKLIYDEFILQFKLIGKR